jgi:hypothetical protein
MQVALAVPNTSGTGSASTSKEVVLVVCDAAHSQGIDAFRSWCQSTALAELDNTIVLAADDDCSHVAHEAGLHSTPYSRPQASMQKMHGHTRSGAAGEAEDPRALSCMLVCTSVGIGLK